MFKTTLKAIIIFLLMLNAFALGYYFGKIANQQVIINKITSCSQEIHEANMVWLASLKHRKPQNPIHSIREQARKK